jgi:hypothetical protein
VDQADEVTTFRDSARRFQSRTNVAFTGATCFVLSEKGALVAGTEADSMAGGSANSAEIISLGSRLPRWECESRALYLGSQVVKRYRRPLPTNQEIILMAFQEEGWPCRIDDPLPPRAELDPKYRLHFTIQCLNQRQQPHLIRFFGDGTGEGVCWEFFKALSPSRAQPVHKMPRKRCAA